MSITAARVTRDLDVSTGRASLTWFEGVWLDGHAPIISAASHASWLGTVVFDGARYFEGVCPDLDRHCARAVQSARLLGMRPMVTGPEIEELAWDGIGRFPAGAELYVRPMFFCEEGMLMPDPEGTRFALHIKEAPFPRAEGFTACLSRFRRPARDAAPTDAKAACLYPNVIRAVQDANARGFDTAVLLDPAGNVAEFCYTNLFIGIGGEVHTPAINGTFLNGLTRQRVIALLREDGVTVVERAIGFTEVEAADEVFATGNYFKLGPCLKVEERHLQPGPLYTRARRLYWEFAHKGR